MLTSCPPSYFCRCGQARPLPASDRCGDHPYGLCALLRGLWQQVVFFQATVVVQVLWASPPSQHPGRPPPLQTFMVPDSVVLALSASSSARFQKWIVVVGAVVFAGLAASSTFVCLINFLVASHNGRCYDRHYWHDCYVALRVGVLLHSPFGGSLYSYSWNF